MSTFVMGVEYVQVSCGGGDNGRCDLQFAMTEEFYRTTKCTGQTWYCPKGHGRVWGGATTETQLADAKAREVALQDQLSAAIRDAEAARVELLRIHARIANGVCPCCQRSFDNVRRHIASKHPDFATPSTVVKKYRCSCGRRFETFAGLRIHQGRSRYDGWDTPSASSWNSHLTVVPS